MHYTHKKPEVSFRKMELKCSKSSQSQNSVGKRLPVGPCCWETDQTAVCTPSVVPEKELGDC